MTLKRFKLCKSDSIRYDLKYVININVFFRDRNDRWVYRIRKCINYPTDFRFAEFKIKPP